MGLWKQRNSTAVQLDATMVNLPPELLATIPTLPHAAARLSQEKFNTDQQRRDEEEGLTPEILGITIQPPVHPEDSTDPTPLPTTEIQFMSRQLTGIKVRRGRKSFKRKSTSSIAIPTVVASANEPIITTDLSMSPIARLILRVIRYKRKRLIRNTVTYTTPSGFTAITPTVSQIPTNSEELVVTTDPSTISAPARLAGGMRIWAHPTRPPKRVRADDLTNNNQKRANINSSPSDISRPTSTLIVRDNKPSSSVVGPAPSSKRKHPSSDSSSTICPKRHRSSERQEVFQLNTSAKGKDSRTDNIDFINIDLPSIDFNVCALTESAKGDSQGDHLASVPVEVEKDIFNFTSNVVFFSPADNVSGMDFASVVLPIHDTNVCVLASPVALELASAID